MSDSVAADDNQVMRDVVMPGIFLLVMFVGNAILFAFIMYKRKRVVWEDPSTYEACLETQAAVAEAPASNGQDGGGVVLEMEQLKH